MLCGATHSRPNSLGCKLIKYFPCQPAAATGAYEATVAAHAGEVVAHYDGLGRGEASGKNSGEGVDGTCRVYAPLAKGCGQLRELNPAYNWKHFVPLFYVHVRAECLRNLPQFSQPRNIAMCSTRNKVMGLQSFKRGEKGGGRGQNLGKEEVCDKRGAKEDQRQVVEVPRNSVSVHCIPKLHPLVSAVMDINSIWSVFWIPSTMRLSQDRGVPEE